MKRIKYSFALIILLPINLMAQDVIITREGKEIMSRVLKIEPLTISYKKFDNLEGPTYSIEKSQVLMIQFENGTREVFEAQVVNTRKDDLPLPEGSFNVNPLGILQFGPIFQYEAKIANQLYFVPYFRYGYAGVITHALWWSADELSPTTAGLGAGLKYFDKPAGDTWYYGGFLEYNWLSATFAQGFTDETEERRTGVAITGNFGYRWRRKSGSSVSVGLFLGVDSSLTFEETLSSTGEVIAEYSEVVPYGLIELAFGWDSKKK